MGYRTAITDGLGPKRVKKYLKVEINKRLTTFSKRQTNSLDFVIGPTCSYQTTFDLVRKAFLKLLPFKTVFGLGFR